MWDEVDGTADGDGDGVLARELPLDAVTDPGFAVNTNTFGDQASPAVAAGPDGTFVVVWDSDPTYGGGYRWRQDGSEGAIVARPFLGSGLLFSDGFESGSTSEWSG